MKLNLPILDQIKGARHILIAGMGGGYDVFVGLPLFLELEQLGFDVHLANLSFSDITGLTEGEALTDTLVGVNTDIDGIFDYFPEYFLSQWFYDERNEDVTIWCFEKTGLRALLKDYQVLVKHLGIDAIILVDGGVDSLLRGDESYIGTMLEDSLSLLAVNSLTGVPIKLLACLGFGIEQEMNYTEVLENMAHITKDDGFRGCCALMRQMPSYQSFEQAVLQVFDEQPAHPSVICSSIIAAVRGEFGDYHLIKRTKGSQLHISPLMPVYWFFEVQSVAQSNLLNPYLRLTYTIEDAWEALQSARKTIPRRLPAEPPLA